MRSSLCNPSILYRNVKSSLKLFNKNLICWESTSYKLIAIEFMKMLNDAKLKFGRLELIAN